jgi:AhpD family alkylhydroperoxidase
MTQLPKPYVNFQEQYPDVWQAYNQLGAAVHAAGPLDEKTRGLIKLALAIGAGREGAVHAHVRKLVEMGVSPDEIRQVALLAVTTLGFPATMTGLTWINDVLE